MRHRPAYLQRRRLGINVTPLIDVLFLLVIFVLVTARFEEVAAIGVELPHGESREPPPTQTLVLTVTAQGDCYLGEDPVGLDALGERLRAAKDRDRQTTLVVRADRRVPWERVAQALDTARAAELRRVAFQIAR